MAALVAVFAMLRPAAARTHPYVMQPPARDPGEPDIEC
jgi:hypothetical protein